MMRPRLVASALFLSALVIAEGVPAAAAGGPDAGSVRIAMHDGRVSIVATEATLAEILAEWARVGGTTIVNGELVTGAVVTVELTDVPETEALSVLLRSSGGYLAVSRDRQSASASQFARIVIMPMQAPIAVTAAARPAPAMPVFLQPTTAAANSPTPGVTRILGPNGEPVSDDQEGAPPFVPGFRPPKGFTYGDDPDHRTPPAQSSAPIGTRAPGVIVPAPLANRPVPPQPLP